jgi:hypothetical protein
VLVYDHFDSNEFSHKEPDFVPTWLPEALRRNDATKEYAYRARNILRHVGFQARGRASGVHGLLHQYVRRRSGRTSVDPHTITGSASMQSLFLRCPHTVLMDSMLLVGESFPA